MSSTNYTKNPKGPDSHPTSSTATPMLGAHQGKTKEKLFIRIVDFERLQHYKHRRPAWIKLHIDILDDYRYAKLTDMAKGHLVLLGLLASLHQNCIELHHNWLRTRLQLKHNLRITELQDAGFIEVFSESASKVLAPCLQRASNVLYQSRVEKSREEERRGEGEGEAEPKTLNPPPATPHVCQYKEIQDMWNELLKEARPLVQWTPERKKNMNIAWQEHPTINWWKILFEQIGESDFLMGRRSFDDIPFIVSLDWLIKPENFANTIEGKYSSPTTHNTRAGYGHEEVNFKISPNPEEQKIGWEHVSADMMLKVRRESEQEDSYQIYHLDNLNQWQKSGGLLAYPAALAYWKNHGGTTKTKH